MLHTRIAHEHLTRIAMALALAAVGLASFAWPRCLAGVAGYFTRWAAGLGPPPEKQRVSRVVAAREDAEGISSAYGRYLGVAAFVLAGLEAVSGLPFIVPYALFCLASAGVTLLAYLQFRRAVQQRVAPLVRRSPFDALPPWVIVSVGCCFAISLALVAYPPQRFGALLVAIATMVLGGVAWRIAIAPALLVGDDPQWEYAVDERVRVGRARAIANLACAPGAVLIWMVQPDLPQQYALLGSVAMFVAAAAFAISLVASIVPLRGRLRAA